MSSAAVDSVNSITSAEEIHTWLHNPPCKYVAYVKVTGPTTGILTTWTGEKLGSVYIGKSYRSGFNSKRRSIIVKGINGKEYYGTYYESSGDYARITMYKEMKG